MKSRHSDRFHTIEMESSSTDHWSKSYVHFLIIIPSIPYFVHSTSIKSSIHSSQRHLNPLETKQKISITPHHLTHLSPKHIQNPSSQHHPPPYSLKALKSVDQSTNQNKPPHIKKNPNPSTQPQADKDNANQHFPPSKHACIPPRSENQRSTHCLRTWKHTSRISPSYCNIDLLTLYVRL